MGKSPYVSWLSCLSDPVPAAILGLYGQSCPISVTLSYLPCPICSVPPVLSVYPVPPVLSQLSCSIALVHRSPFPTVRSLLYVLASRPLCPVLPDMSRLNCQSNLSTRTCLGSCHGFPTQLSCPSCTVLLSCPGHPFLSFLSCLYHPDILQLSFPGCPA
jgi:hypothetical protein